MNKPLIYRTAFSPPHSFNTTQQPTFLFSAAMIDVEAIRFNEGSFLGFLYDLQPSHFGSVLLRSHKLSRVGPCLILG